MVNEIRGTASNLTEYGEVLKSVPHGAVDHIRNTVNHNVTDNRECGSVESALEVIDVHCIPVTYLSDIENGHCWDELREI